MAEFEKRNDHIGVFHDAIDEGVMDGITDTFEYYSSLGHTARREDYDLSHAVLEKTDESVALAQVSYQLKDTIRALTQTTFFQTLNDEIIPMYKDAYGMRADIDLLSVDGKIQKTRQGEGYHIWHYEQDSHMTKHRVLAWMLYMNDVEEGGETEFLHQRCRFKPTRGTLLVWPAHFTHVHRGNPPLSGEKIILTGWSDYNA